MEPQLKNMILSRRMISNTCCIFLMERDGISLGNISWTALPQTWHIKPGTMSLRYHLILSIYLLLSSAKLYGYSDVITRCYMSQLWILKSLLCANICIHK